MNGEELKTRTRKLVNPKARIPCTHTHSVTHTQVAQKMATRTSTSTLASSVRYEVVPTDDEEAASLIREGLEDENDYSRSGIGGGADGDYRAGVLVLTHSAGPVPITRLPHTGRDMTYSFLFICHFGVIFALSTYDVLDVEDSFIRRRSEGLWTSMVMTVTILGFFIGALVVFLILNTESRDYFISVSVPFSIFIQICLGNVLLHFRSYLSILGVVFLISAVICLHSYKPVMKDVSFNCAVIGFISDVLGHYGSAIVLGCLVIAFAQTCILLWWGVFLVDFVGDVPRQYLQYIIVLMLFSLYWIMQYFHAFMAYVVGGCFVWYFVGDNSTPMVLLSQSSSSGLADEMGGPSRAVPLGNLSNRVLLHMQGAVTCSLGSLCKGALLCPPNNAVMLWHAYWHRRRLQSIGSEHIGAIPGGFGGTGGCFGPCINACCGCCGVCDVCYGLVERMAHQARSQSRLSYALAATYGLTLNHSMNVYNSNYPQSLDCVLRDTGRWTLAAIPIHVAGLIALLYGTFAGRNEPANTQLLFIILIYGFSYCGISICVSILQAAIDALFIVFSLYPERLARENQIIFLRLLRYSEEESG
jgi:hypothetical protein